MAESRVAELAREEAERAEAEQAETPPEPEPSEPEPSEPELEPQPGALANIGPEEIRKAERAIEAQRKKLAGILGEEAVAHDCPLCAGMGYMPALPPDGSTFRLAYGEDGPVVMPESPAPDVPLKHAPDKDTCPECDGLGQVLSGSLNPHARIVGCSRCQGNGWVTVPREAPAPPVASVPPPPPPGAVPTGTDQLGMDTWGRPAGHRHWGVPPAAIPA